MAMAKRASEAPGTRRSSTAREARVRWRRTAKRVVRWIRASSRRQTGSAQEIQAKPASVPAQVQGGNVVTLTWAQTFGRVTQRTR